MYAYRRYKRRISKFPEREIAFWRHWNMSVWWQGILQYINPRELLNPLDKFRQYVYHTLKSFSVNDAYNQPSRVNVEKGDIDIKVSIEDKADTKYWIPPSGGGMRALVDDDTYSAIEKFIVGDENVKKQAIVEGAKNDLPREVTNAVPAENIEQTLQSKGIPVSANSAVAIHALEGMYQTETYSMTASGHWGISVSSVEEAALEIQRELAEINTRLSSLESTVRETDRKFMATEDAVSKAINVLKSLPAPLYSDEVLAVEDVSTEMEGYSVLVNGTADGDVGVIVMGGEGAYTVFTLTDETGSIEVWLPCNQYYSTTHMYKGRKILVCGIVDSDPYLHLLCPSEDCIVLFD